MAKYMKVVVLFSSAALVLFFNMSAWGMDEGAGSSKGKKTSVNVKDNGSHSGKAVKGTAGLFAYKPPLRGAPGGRIGGGTRMAGGDHPSLMALVPDHTGLSTRAQPSLYWYLSRPSNRKIEFTLNDEEAGRTLIQTFLKSDVKVGIVRVDLSDFDVTLSPDREYTWFISLVLDPNQPSRDVYSGGKIKRISPSEGHRQKPAKASGTDVAVAYAEKGIWYDSLDILSRLIESNPTDHALRRHRADLFDQVGLHEPAEFERAGIER